MIDYDFGYWGVAFVFKSGGSTVFRRAVCIATPSAVLAFVLGFFTPRAGWLKGPVYGLPGYQVRPQVTSLPGYWVGAALNHGSRAIERVAPQTVC